MRSRIEVLGYLLLTLVFRAGQILSKFDHSAPYGMMEERYAEFTR